MGGLLGDKVVVELFRPDNTVFYESRHRPARTRAFIKQSCQAFPAHGARGCIDPYTVQKPRSRYNGTLLRPKHPCDTVRLRATSYAVSVAAS
jgi:hypothetical protein